MQEATCLEAAYTLVTCRLILLLLTSWGPEIDWETESHHFSLISSGEKTGSGEAVGHPI